MVKTPQQNGVAERKHRHLQEPLDFKLDFPNIFGENALCLPLTLLTCFPWKIYAGKVLLKFFMASNHGLMT